MTISRRCACGKRFHFEVSTPMRGPRKCEACRGEPLRFGRARLKALTAEERAQEADDGSGIVRDQEGRLTTAKVLAVRMLKG